MVTPSNTAEAVAVVASEALISAKIPRRDAADLTGIPIATLQRRLTGRTPFDFEQLERVAKVAGTSVWAIVAEAERRVCFPAGDDGTSDITPDLRQPHVEDAERSTPSAGRAS